MPLSCLLEGIFKNCLKHGSHKGLNKEQLCKKGEGKVKANKLQPRGKQLNHVEALIVGIVQKGGNQAHGRAHKPNRCADNGGFENHRMILPGVKYTACQLEGQRAAHKYLKYIGKAELH